MEPPPDKYRSLYKKAIAQTQRNVDRVLLEQMEDRMVAAGTDYDKVMVAQGPSGVTEIPLTADEATLVGALYEKRVVSKDGACRKIYEEIFTSAASCPYCIDGEIYEVDHFLPQVHHRDIVMYPRNLVPICHPCNHIKLHLRPVDARNSLLHPYFDRLPDQPWLFAQLERKADGPVLNYWIELDEALHGDIARRLKYHFATLQLGRRMRTRSAKILVELQADVESYLLLIGPGGLQAHFAAEAVKHYDRHRNTLEAAAYRAAACNPQFCAGDYRN